MAYRNLDQATRSAAEKVLTRKQLDVFKLWCAGAGMARIGMMLDISPSTARSHKNRAIQKLNIELRRKEAA